MPSKTHWICPCGFWRSLYLDVQEPLNCIEPSYDCWHHVSSNTCQFPHDEMTHCLVLYVVGGNVRGCCFHRYCYSGPLSESTLLVAFAGAISTSLIGLGHLVQSLLGAVLLELPCWYPVTLLTVPLKLFPLQNGVQSINHYLIFWYPGEAAQPNGLRDGSHPAAWLDL